MIKNIIVTFIISLIVSFEEKGEICWVFFNKLHANKNLKKEKYLSLLIACKQNSFISSTTINI